MVLHQCNRGRKDQCKKKNKAKFAHDNADDDDDDDAFINKLASDLDDSYQEVWDAVFKKGVDDLDDDLSL